MRGSATGSTISSPALPNNRLPDARFQARLRRSVRHVYSFSDAAIFETPFHVENELAPCLSTCTS